jgi:hypothetical protein
VNSYAEDLRSHDFVLNAGANDIYKNNKGVALTEIISLFKENMVLIL